MKLTTSKFSAALLVLCLIIVTSCKKEKSQVKQGPCYPEWVDDVLIAGYMFDQGSLSDISGNANDLINNSDAAASSDRAGNPGCAYQFENITDSTQFLKTADALFLDGLQSLSVSLWYQPLENELADFEALISRGEGPDCPDRIGQWSAGLYDCRRAVFSYETSSWDNLITDPALEDVCENEIAVRTGLWQHLAAVYDEVAGTVRIYRNGVFQEEQSTPADCGPNETVEVVEIGEFFVGKYYTGKIDDLLLFNVALSEDQILELLHEEPCCGIE